VVTAKRSFEKKATTYDEQVAKIKQRGMNITDLPNAKFYLQHLNYYRLIAYWLHLKQIAQHTHLNPGRVLTTY
jgi:abortive infection bacteriophage resistance protein